jgi:Endosomal/lysosomal potassium channel TMEM175
VAGAARTVGTVTTSRLEAFSDGVLAIAITLLVIEIRPPEVHEGERLAHALWAQWPSYVAYLVSFLTIGVIWLNHHRIFEQVARVDGPLLLLNLNLLLWTALIPFPTAVVAEHLGGAGEAARTASALYSGVLLLMGLAFGRCSPGSPTPIACWAGCRPRGWCERPAGGSWSGRPSMPPPSPCRGCRRRLPWPCVGSWRCTTPSTRRRCGKRFL